MPPKTDIDHWKINATVYKDRVEEAHYITDPARNIAPSLQTKVWKVQKYLGRGAFGEVRLEENLAGKEARAVKRIITESTDLNSEHCEREIKALLEFSKPEVNKLRIHFYHNINLC
jgi:serine/threonine protein kinase